MSGWRALIAALGDPDGASEAAASTAALFGAGRPAPTIPWADAALAASGPLMAGEMDPVVRDLALARVLRELPGVHLADILTEATVAFTSVLQAWSELDAQRSRAHLDQALWEAHRSRMELSITNGRRNIVEPLRVRHAAIVAADPGPPVRVTVRFDATGPDYDLDGSGAVVRGDRSPFDWSHDWVVEYRPALPGRCPNCGAPAEVVGRGVCAACSAPLLVQGIWVVVAAERVDDEVVRRESLLGGAPGPAPAPEAVAAGSTAHDPAAVALLTSVDPAFDPAAVVAHVTAAFSALRAAWASMSPDPARPYLTEGAATELGAAIESLRTRGLRRLADVPLVTAVRIEHADDGDGLLSMECRVRASVIDADADASGRVLRGSDQLQEVVCALQLRRHAGARSSSSTVSLVRCDRCGAPVRASVLGLCDHCRAAIAAGGGAWPIVAVGPLDPAPRDAGAAPPAPAGRPDIGLGLLDPLRAADPALDPYGVVVACRELYWRVEGAMAALDVGSCDAALEPDLAARLRAHADALRSAGHVVIHSFLDIRAVRVIAATQQGDVATATLRVTASASDIDRDRAGAVLSSDGPRVWDEDWTLRRADPNGPWRVGAIEPVPG